MQKLHLHKRFYTLVFLLVMASLGYGQERLGLRIGNYSGIHGAMFNPALPSESPLKWEVSLFSGGAFFEQNYMYFEKTSIARLIKAEAEQIFRSPRKFSGLGTAEAHGPSFMFKVKDHTFGFFAGGRAWANINRADGDLNYDNVRDSVIFIGNIQPFTAGVMAWGEVGLNYSHEIMKTSFFTITGGINFKFLLGLDGAHLWNKNRFDMLKTDDGVRFVDPKVRMAYASNYNDEGYEYNGFNGYGAAVDIGVTITDNDAITAKRHHYWKLGLSLLDFGFIRFSKDAHVHLLDSEDTLTFSRDGFQNFNTLDDVAITTNLEVLNSFDPRGTEVKNSFGMWLPTAAAVYMDYALADYVYITGAATIPFAFRHPSVRRKGMFSITPRFEMSYIEIGVPVVMFQYRYPRIGTYLRLGPLTIGTDNLNSFILPGRLDGSDFYISLKFHGKLKEKRMNPGRCPEF